MSSTQIDTDKNAPWLVTVSKKREIQRSQIALFADVKAPSNADAITAIDTISELAGEIAAGRLTVYDVTVAYIHR